MDLIDYEGPRYTVVEFDLRWKYFMLFHYGIK